MIKTQYINLNMVPSGVMPILYCSQYDVGRPLGMVVYNGGEAVDLDTYTCTIEATRTDGTAITAAVTTDRNIGAFETTATMTNKADHYPAKLVLFDSNSRRVASLAFVMCVTPATMDENAESIEEDASLYQQYTGTVQTLIADIRSQLTDLKDDTQNNEKAIIEKRGMVTVDMWMDNKIPSAYTLQGGCYTENGRFVFAVQTGTTDMVKLFCVDSNTFSTVWESSPLKLYHANSVAYRPQDRKLYIAACFSDTDTNTLLKTILVVDYDTHASIEKTITSPAPGGIYSVAHDAETDKFYSTNYRGTTSGQADMLYEYNGIFESVSRTIQLDDLSVHDPVVHSSQGVQVVANGMAFFPYYKPGCTVVGYSLEDGSRTVIGNIPDIANEYRNVGELEFLAYDGNDFYIGFKAVNTGIPGNTFWNIAKIGLFHNILIHNKFPYEGSISGGDFEVTGAPLDLHKASHKPSSMDARFYSLSDIIRYQRFNNSFINVLVQNSADQDNLVIGHVSASGFKGAIAPRYSGKTVQIEKLALRDSIVRFESCRFIGTDTTPTGKKANLIVRSGDDYLILSSCSFEDVSGNDFGISAHDNSVIKIPYAILSALSYAKMYARNTKIHFLDNAFRLVSANEFDFNTSVDFTGIGYVLKALGDIAIGTQFSIDGVLVNRSIKVTSAQNSVTENIINTTGGIGTIKFNDSGSSGAVRRVVYDLNTNDKTMTLKTVNYFENTGYRSETHFNNVIYQ